jgi:hypothetical protein
MNAPLLRLPRACLGLSLFLFACPTPVVECIEGDEPTCDAGALPPDFCNTRQEADEDVANCHLTVNDAMGTERKTDIFISRLADGGIDKDWYLATMPALTPRSLLHLNAGYAGGVAQTAVNFALTVLRDQPDGGMVAIANGVDRHGTAAPKAVDLVVPFSESGTKLYLLVGDEASGTQLRVDNRNPYSVFVQVRENPDLNEPNDTMPTLIPLAAAGENQQGSTSGYLATNDDVDVYSFSVATAGQIIYLHLTGPNSRPLPTPAFGRLAYTMYDPMNQPIAADEMANDGLAIDLATARKAQMTGTYTVHVRGYREQNSTAAIKGDLTLKYDVSVVLLPEKDLNEPNDAFAQAKAQTLTPNASAQLVGRLSYVPDDEWFVLTLPSRPVPSVLRWTTTVAMGGGRFAPLTGVPTRQFRVMSRVTEGATAQDKQKACSDSQTACPKGYDDSSGESALLVKDLCRITNPTQCLLAQRTEHPKFANLKNHVGALPIEPNKATELYLVLRDEGQGRAKYADDREWHIDLQWNDDADEASRVGGPTQVTLSTGLTPAPGVLSFGHGRVLDPFDLNSGDGVRAPLDYDAFETDKDLFQFNFGTATGEQTWAIEWELTNLDGGTTPPAELALELSLCTGTGPVPDGGLCAGENRRPPFAYTGDRLSPWYLPPSFGNAQVLFDRRVQGNSTIFSARAAGCWCLNGPRIASGKMFANVASVNRVSNEPLRYEVRQSINPYPGMYTERDGGSATCPIVDAGCGFAR